MLAVLMVSLLSLGSLQNRASGSVTRYLRVDQFKRESSSPSVKFLSATAQHLLPDMELKRISTLHWGECPQWLPPYIQTHKSAIQKWRVNSTPAILYDCEETNLLHGCKSGIGDRLRAAMETLKVLLLTVLALLIML
jgi:hypothetical protein